MSDRLETLTDEALAKMAQKGDRTAFNVLCDRHLAAVHNRLRARLPPEAVEDVTQEVFVAAVRSIKRYRERSLFRTWLGGIMRHKVADFYRRRSRQAELTVLDERADQVHHTTNAWKEHTQVRLALQELPSHYQEVILLRFAEGLQFKEIAGTLDISLEAAKSRYRRAVSALAQEMEVD